MKTIPINEELRQAAERMEQRDWEQYRQKQVELYRQTDRYKEYEKRKLAELEAEENKEE